MEFGVDKCLENKRPKRARCLSKWLAALLGRSFVAILTPASATDLICAMMKIVKGAFYPSSDQNDIGLADRPDENC